MAALNGHPVNGALARVALPGNSTLLKPVNFDGDLLDRLEAACPGLTRKVSSAIHHAPQLKEAGRTFARLENDLALLATACMNPLFGTEREIRDLSRAADAMRALMTHVKNDALHDPEAMLDAEKRITASARFLRWSSELPAICDPAVGSITSALTGAIRTHEQKVREIDDGAREIAGLRRELGTLMARRNGYEGRAAELGSEIDGFERGGVSLAGKSVGGNYGKRKLGNDRQALSKVESGKGKVELQIATAEEYLNERELALAVKRNRLATTSVSDMLPGTTLHEVRRLRENLAAFRHAGERFELPDADFFAQEAGLLTGMWNGLYQATARLLPVKWEIRSSNTNINTTLQSENMSGWSEAFGLPVSGLRRMCIDIYQAQGAKRPISPEADSLIQFLGSYFREAGWREVFATVAPLRRNQPDFWSGVIGSYEQLQRSNSAVCPSEKRLRAEEPLTDADATRLVFALYLIGALNVLRFESRSPSDSGVSLIANGLSSVVFVSERSVQ